MWQDREIGGNCANRQRRGALRPSVHRTGRRSLDRPDRSPRRHSMARPRRAARRRLSGRILVSSTLIGVTAVATLAIWQMSDTEASLALPAAEESAVID